MKLDARTKNVKPLIIGQAPSFDGHTNFEGRSGQRLAELCGITHEEFLRRFERRNLFREFPGRRDGARGDQFDMEQARLRAIGFANELHGRETVLIGFRVAAAFGMPVTPLMWFPIPYGGSLATSPHPSGTNRWWNNDRNAEDARRFWAAFAESHR